ncbi:peptidylglycine alpha-hydroxylating monooxygenase [Tribolium castaneum]|uniref:peptidylglycine monooxygenase n=1 Tax=Tribolium castaneum TaxID=7070 RepID=D2A0D2_TRICA|nr:PREDICTED: peptidylglycine alpha-hydroxylating monooxygenase [Tribolium castaneum]EFA01712.1 Peptidylglycine alpha-hydroxylating monooxygenase-like Protein [Tribolium castaneum]|eukprot:XP_975610.1 PREDICTED: peptidylglycine alpha-hydroxylating monooxygenase [Tribolium castaneum]
MGGRHTLHIVGAVLILIQATCCLQVKKFPLLMPNVYPDREESYFCTPVRVVPDKSFYIVGFEPVATMDVVHHMIVFGCSKPGTTDPFWDCGEMASDSSSTLRKANPCAEGSNVIYAWALNAKPLQLPENVGFQVGEGSKIQYLVLQIHYSKKFKENESDNSGLNLIYTEEPQSKLAGVLLLGTGGAIPPRSVTHMETLCQIREKKTIYPIAYRTHTHSLGQVVSGYSVRRDKSGVDHWSLLGKRNPNTPQMFYPIFNKGPIRYGDRLAARCTMDSTNRTDYTIVGPKHDNEMCNFYIIYYVEEGTPLDMKYCISEGPPYFYWRNEENDLNNIPDDEASNLI